MANMVEVLRNVPLFSEMAADELARLASITARRQYNRHSLVFMQAEPREAVFFIESGVIKTYKVDKDGNEQVIAFLKAGDMFPHVGFFDNSPYPATAEVVRNAELLLIRIEDFDQLLMAHPPMAIKVMKIMGQKLLHLQERLQDLISSDVHRRVVYSLIRLAHEYGEQQNGGMFISLPMTNRDFANMVGTSRESINRTLNQLKKEKLLEIHRNGIFVYDLDALQKAD